MIKKIVYKIRRLLQGITNEQLTLDANIKVGLTVGKNCSGLLGCTLDYGHAWLITIGDNVVFAPQVYLLAHDTSTKKIVNYTKIASINIGNNCFIGARAIIMPGVSIGDNTIVGSGSVVTKSFAENLVIAGNPAKIISTLDKYTEKIKSDFDKKKHFDKTYTLLGGITPLKKKEMKQFLNDTNGYVS